MYCPNCGNKCEDDAKYCRKCGKALYDTAEADDIIYENYGDSAEDITYENYGNSADNTAYENHGNSADNIVYENHGDSIDNITYETYEKKKNSTAIIIGIVAAAIIVVAILIFILSHFIINKKHAESTDTVDLTENQVDVRTDDMSKIDEEDAASGAMSGAEDDKAGSADNQGASGDVDWRTIYLDYCDHLKRVGRLNNYLSAGLIYVDDDDIPELYLEGDCEATGCLILTCKNGVVDELQTSRLYFNYIERQNLLDNVDGHMGYYYDYVYTIEDGKWKCIGEGTYEAVYGDTGYVVDENGNAVMEYTWMGEPTDEAGYDQKLKEVYDGRLAIDPVGYTWDEFYSILETGSTTSANHCYELIVDDVTWKEAEELCRQKGGYLATLTSKEEFDRVTRQIEDEGKTGISFFVGATRDNEYTGNYGYCWVHDHQNDNMFSSAMGSFWLPGEPSYSETREDNVTVEEMYVDYIYRKSDGRGYLNDVTNDILEQAPSLKGAIGYICEYDS